MVPSGVVGTNVVDAVMPVPIISTSATVELATVELATVELATVELATVELATVELATVETPSPWPVATTAASGSGPVPGADAALAGRTISSPVTTYSVLGTSPV